MTDQVTSTSAQPDTASATATTAPGTDGQPAAAPGADQQQTGTAPAADGKQDAVDGTTGKADAKPDGETKPNGDVKPEDQVPEQYEDFTVPEGVALDVEVATELKGLAKELKLPQAKAQQIADLGAKLAQKWDAKQAEAISTAVAKWGDDTRTDKEIGGDKLNENLAVAKKALDSFGTPELKQLLVSSGLGNHPEIIRAFYRAGKAISEDGKLVTGDRRNTTPKSAAQTLYPNQS